MTLDELEDFCSMRPCDSAARCSPVCWEPSDDVMRCVEYEAATEDVIRSLPMLVTVARSARAAINRDGAVILAECKAVDDALRAIEGNTYTGPCLNCDHFDAHNATDGAGCTHPGCSCPGRETRNRYRPQRSCPRKP